MSLYCQKLTSEVTHSTFFWSYSLNSRVCTSSWKCAMTASDEGPLCQSMKEDLLDAAKTYLLWAWCSIELKTLTYPAPDCPQLKHRGFASLVGFTPQVASWCLCLQADPLWCTHWRRVKTLLWQVQQNKSRPVKTYRFHHCQVFTHVLFGLYQTIFAKHIKGTGCP